MSRWKILLCCLLLLGIADLAASQIFDAGDQAVLKNLYDGFQSTSPLNWNFADPDCANYNGVACDPSGKVILLNLRSMVLKGILSPSLAQLTSLSSVDFTNTGVAGTIPAGLEQIPALAYFAFSNCNLRGTLPSEIAQLPNLQQLSLDDNDLTGTIHGHFFTQPYIDYLDLQANDFVGTLPSSGARTNFNELFLADNSFNCPLQVYSTWTQLPSENDYEPNCIAAQNIASEDVSALRALYNGFTNAATKLSSWDVNAVQWSCISYPGVVCDNNGRVTSLFLGRLGLTGVVDPAIGNLTMLTDLALDYNLLGGDLPVGIGLLSDLEYLWLGSNYFTFPDYSGWGSEYTDSPSDCRIHATLVFNSNTSLYQCQCDDGYFLTSGVCVAVSCPEESYDHGYFPSILASVAGAPSAGSCDSGYYSTAPSRKCYQQGDVGVWDVNVTNPCTGVYCTEGSNDNSTWPETLSQSALNYVCKPGYYSLDTSATCIQADDIAILSPISQQCLAVNCAADNSDPTVTWPVVLSARAANGTCATGYYSANPQRYCLQNGATATYTTVTNPCLPVYCPVKENYNNANFGQIQAPAVATGVCMPGFYSALGPQLTCSQGSNQTGIWSTSVVNPCTQVYCSSGSDAVSTWPTTKSANLGTFTCKPGYFSPEPTMYCVPQGSTAFWGRVQHPCTLITCAEDDTDATTYWPEVQASKVANGTCKAGYFLSGIPKRTCTQQGDEGVWQTPSLPCNAVYCPAASYSNATWNQTLAATSTSGTCDPGYYSSNCTRQCTQTGATGTWSSTVTNPCQPVYCLQGSAANYTFPQVQAGESGQVTCKPGFYSLDPSATCVQSGSTANWTLPTEPCLPVYCPANMTSGISFPQTQASFNATGTCRTGYAGLIQRLCSQSGPDAAWEAFSGTCLLVPTLPPIPPEGSPLVTTIFRLVNINYDWYRSGVNQETFDTAFIDFVSALFAVNPGAVSILTTSRGSILITFQIYSTAPDALRTAITAAIQNTELNLSILLVALPADAFEDGTLTSYIDPTQSAVQAEADDSSNAGPIAGGVVGGLVALAIIGGVTFYLVRKKKRDEALSAVAADPSTSTDGLTSEGSVIPAQKKADKGKRRLVAGLDTEMEELERT